MALIIVKCRWDGLRFKILGYRKDMPDLLFGEHE